MDSRLIEDRIKSIEASEFQYLCDRMLLKLYKDYTPVRSGGRNGDMKNDGYCFIERIFFQAHATRGESAKATKEKIKSDLEGCLKKQSNVKSFIYITNDTLIGEIETFVDSLRTSHPNIIIETWTPKRIMEKLKDMSDKDIEFILDRNVSGTSNTFNNNDGSKVINQGIVNIDNQTINY
jgi:hypothetical protein